MNNVNPLELPEIRTIVGRLLPHKDLVRCLSVSKSWHRSLVPLAWSAVTIEPDRPNPAVEVLRRHSQLVKELRYHIMLWPGYMSIEYPNLTCLGVFDTPRNDPYSLHWKPTEGLHNISKLELRDIVIESSDTTTLWDLCLRLEALGLDNISIPGVPDKPVIFERLRALSLSLVSNITPRQQMDWIARCPNLNVLSWACRVNKTQDEVDEFVTHFTTGAWSKLCGLNLRGFTVSDEQLARMIEGMQKVLMLDLPGCAFGQLSLKALHRHFPFVRHLNIFYTGAPTSSTVLKILASCPRLEFLITDVIMRIFEWRKVWTNWLH
ncbi:hypothetical protein B0O80DRAFT_186844 [Mortierella sp. GBAus27b]|nr:hypothetical protein B0O80DRAFT_186844 [Mortierella sp. GBAus27b]